MARPKISGSTAREPSRTLSVRLSAADYAALTATAEALGVPLSEHARAVLAERMQRRQWDAGELRRLTYHVARGAESLTAIAEHANALRLQGGINFDQFAGLLRELQQCRELFVGALRGVD